MRTFSLVDGTSDKFWHVDVAGDTVTVHFGRTGTKGQVRSTAYASAEQAATEAAKLVAAKVRKGYVEGGAGAAIAPVAPQRTSAAATPAPVVVPAVAPVVVPAVAPVVVPAVASGPGGDREVVAPGDLGLVLYRVEEAAQAWGRPLDAAPPDAAPPAEAAPTSRFTPAEGERAVRALGLKHQEYGVDLVFPTLPFDGVPAPEEGRWWLWWMRCHRPDEGERHFAWPTVAQRFARARERYLGQPPPVPGKDWPEDYWFLRVAADLAVRSPEAVLRHCCRGNAVAAGAVPALRALVVPRLDAAEVARLRKELVRGRRAAFDKAVASALLADPQEHLERLERAADDLLVVPSHGVDFYRWDGLVAVLGALPDRADAGRLADRFGHHRSPHTYCTFHPALIPGLLGALGSEALPVLEERIAGETNRAVAEAHLAFLAARVNGPGAVATMVRLAHTSKAPGRARAWLAARPEALAATPEAFRAKDAELVAAVVRQVTSGEPGAFGPDVANPTVRAALADLSGEAATPEIRPGAEPSWWVEAATAEAAGPATGRGSRLPAYAEASMLPSLVVDGARLNPAMVEAAVRSALRGAADPELVPPPLVAALRDRLRPVDRDRVATTLLDGWLGAGAPPKEKAVFVASGFFGADGFVARLVPLVREWPGQSQHARAVLGLDVLVATGRLSALQGISGIASKSKFKGVQEAAGRAMARLAAAAGLSTDQLADRVVPDGGLDARGTRVLSYGPRSFRVTLSPQGKLVVRDLDAGGRPAGKARTALPAPNSKDDAAAAEAARSEFAVLRKQLTELAKVQTARLEQAMVSGRTWSGAEHREYLVCNPLVNSLIRPLVWSVTEDGGRTLARVTEDREYLTVDDDPVVPADGATITLAHPLHLTEAERTAWHEHLVSYDLIPPVEQLDRAVFGLPPGQRGPELDASALPKGKIHPGTLAGILDRFGWRRGNPADGGVVSHAWLAFPAFDRAVVVEFEDGLWTGMISESGDQEISGAMVTTLGAPADIWYVGELKQRFDWTSVDPLIVSETRRTFAAMAEKAT